MVSLSKINIVVERSIVASHNTNYEVPSSSYHNFPNGRGEEGVVRERERWRRGE